MSIPNKKVGPKEVWLETDFTVIAFYNIHSRDMTAILNTKLMHYISVCQAYTHKIDILHNIIWDILHILRRQHNKQFYPKIADCVHEIPYECHTSILLRYTFQAVLEMKIWIYWSESNFWIYSIYIYYIYIVYLNKNWNKVLLVLGRRTSAHHEDCFKETIQ